MTLPNVSYNRTRWWLAPLAWLYGGVLHIRHMLYDDHLLPTYTSTVPTICVGNLAVGGTGKTPHTEYLIRLLSARYHIAVLSRGYGRRTRGFILADANASASTIGDEPMQMHLHFPDVPIAVCEDRVRGVRQLQTLYPDLELIILDDAFQHRRIRAHWNILLTEYDHLFVNDHLLPMGRLRDLKSRVMKANMVVITKCPPMLQPIDKRVLRSRVKLAAFQSLVFSSYQYAPLPHAGNPLIVTGIANPQPLVDYVRTTCPNAGHLAFPDHHRFTQRDVDDILRRAESYDYVLTTEKDKVRFDEIFLSEALGSRMCVMPIQVNIDNEFDQIILSFVAEKLRKNKSQIK